MKYEGVHQSDDTNKDGDLGLEFPVCPRPTVAQALRPPRCLVTVEDVYLTKVKCEESSLLVGTSA